MQTAGGLELGRINVASRGAGIAEGALKLALRYAQERSAFGKPIWQHQAIQLKLADMVTQVEGAKRLIEAAARKYDRGERCDLEAAMAKLAGSEAGVFCAQEAMRIFGGYSYSVEYEIERYYRDCDADVHRRGHQRDPAQRHRQAAHRPLPHLTAATAAPRCNWLPCRMSHGCDFRAGRRNARRRQPLSLRHERIF